MRSSVNYDVHLKVRPYKCYFFATQIHYLGHFISVNGVREWPVPSNQIEVHSFFG